MATISTPRPRAKPARSIRLLSAPTADRPGLVRITAGKLSALYRITVVPADYGAGFELTKVHVVPDEHGVFRCQYGETYAVNLAGSCECKGFLKHGYCKHLDGLRMLATTGRLHAPKQ
jgi:hypothetical protein